MSIAHCDVAAKTRSIAVPADLEAQLTALFSKAQIVQKHTRVWITVGKTRANTVVQLSQDYRSIIEGLQASHNHCHYYCYCCCFSGDHSELRLVQIGLPQKNFYGLLM